jgi:hypothetical protein
MAIVNHRLLAGAAYITGCMTWPQRTQHRAVMRLALLNLSALAETYHRIGRALGRSQMTAIARVLARRLPANQAEVETLKTIGMFCGVGLLVSLMLASYGLDLSAGFF